MPLILVVRPLSSPSPPLPSLLPLYIIWQLDTDNLLQMRQLFLHSTRIMSGRLSQYPLFTQSSQASFLSTHSPSGFSDGLTSIANK